MERGERRRREERQRESVCGWRVEGGGLKSCLCLGVSVCRPPEQRQQPSTQALTHTHTHTESERAQCDWHWTVDLSAVSYRALIRLLL